MKLSEIKKHLTELQNVQFLLPNGTYVPECFHVTEVGLVTKKFIDCGGIVRQDSTINFQLWDANDFDHRLKPKKLLDIIALSEKMFALTNLDIEIEYQDSTIGKYDLDFNGTCFVLVNKQTACLAQDQCGIATPKQKMPLSKINVKPTCAPNSGCC